MGKVLDVLTPEYVDKHADAIARARAAWRKDKPDESPAKLRQIFRKKDPSNLADSYVVHRGSDIQGIMARAALEHARGASPEVVRALYRDAAAQWEPVVAAMDFTTRLRKATISDQSGPPKDLVRDYGATYRRAPGAYHVQYSVITQPLKTEFLEQVLLSAAISGDFDLARRLARAYKLDAAQVSDQSDYRYAVLYYLLAREESAAKAMARKLRPGYMADFPPDLIEFPLGVVRRDPQLLAKGIKTITTRFKGMWDEKKYRRRHAEAVKRHRSGVYPPPTWQRWFNSVRNNLVPKWVLSTYALAYLNVARQRGMESPFDKPALFSEWVPLELC